MYTLATLGNIIKDYTAMRDFKNVLKYSGQMRPYANMATADPISLEFIRFIMGKANVEAYYQLAQLDSALFHAQQLYNFCSAGLAIKNNNNYLSGLAQTSQLLGAIYAKSGRPEQAKVYYRQGIRYGYLTYQFQVVAQAQEGLARLFQEAGATDSALVYARAAMGVLQSQAPSVQSWGDNVNSYIAELSPLIARLYNACNQPDSAYKYLQLSVTLKDSLYNLEKIRQFQNLTFNESVRQQQEAQEAAAARQRYENRVKIYALIAGIGVAVFVALMLYRNSRQKQKANSLLQKKNAEIESTLTELRATQKQLIQSEKMASLGELTPVSHTKFKTR